MIRSILLFLFIANSINFLNCQVIMEVDGPIRIGNSNTALPEAGTIRWSGFNFEGFTGAIWIPLTKPEIVEDYEKNQYKVVRIGAQIWMAENLRSTKDQNGMPIERIDDDTDWVNSLNPAFSNVNGNNGNNIQYGKLYNFYAVSSLTLCPIGWHVPLKQEWVELSEYLGGANLAGAILKEMGQTFWEIPNLGATNAVAYNGRGAGLRNGSSGLYDSFREIGGWWSSSVEEVFLGGMIQLFPLMYQVGYNTSAISSAIKVRSQGYSIRCIKN